MRELLLGLVYFSTALPTLYLANVLGNTAPLWPPGIIAIAVLSRRAPPQLYASVVCCVIGHFGAKIWLGADPFVAAYLSVANGLFVALGTSLCRDVYHRRFAAMPQVALMAAFVLIATVASLPQATMNALMHHHIHGVTLLPVILQWCLANALGFVTCFAPFFLFSLGQLKSSRPALWLELLAVCLLPQSMRMLNLEGPDNLQLAILAGALMWAAFRFSPWLMSLVVTVQILINTGFLTLDLMQSAHGTPDAYAVLELQISTLLVVLPAMLLAFTIETMRRGQAALSSSVERLGAANDEMSQLLQIVSHDLKSPLTTIQGFSGLLKGYTEAGNSKKAIHAAGRIREGAKSMSALIDDILELSRIGRSTFDPSPFALDELVEETKMLLGAKITQKAANVVFETGTTSLVADRSKVLRVLLNLVENALEHGCPDPGMCIRIGAARADATVDIYVRDEGPGIISVDKSRLFELFYRGATKGAGTGAGLAVAKKAVDRHGGSIWAYSQPGSGATFWVSLPKTIGTQGTRAPI